MLRVIDDALPAAIQDALEDLLMGTGFPWYLQESTTPFGAEELRDDERDSPFMGHLLVSKDTGINSPFCDEVLGRMAGLFAAAGSSSVIQARANLSISSQAADDGAHTPFHVDLPTPHTVVLYYVNDSSGSTVFERGDEIIPRKGRAVIFDGALFHGMRLPSSGPRCVLNVNLA